MGITKGTVIRREKSWAWKYRAEGRTCWEMLNLPKGSSKREAQTLRDARLQQFRETHGTDAAASWRKDVDELCEWCKRQSKRATGDSVKV